MRAKYVKKNPALHKTKTQDGGYLFQRKVSVNRIWNYEVTVPNTSRSIRKSFSDLATEFQQWAKQKFDLQLCSESYYRRTQYILPNWVRHLKGAVLTDINEERVAGYAEFRRTELPTIKLAKLRQEFTAYKDAIDFAVKRKLLSKDTAVYPDFKPGRRATRKRIWFDPPDVDQLFAYLDGKYLADSNNPITFLVFLGAMLGAITSTHAAPPTLEDVLAMERIPMTETCRTMRENGWGGPEDFLEVAPLSEDSAILFVSCAFHTYQSTKEVIRLDRKPAALGVGSETGADSGTIEATLLAFPRWLEREGTPAPYVSARSGLVGLEDALLGSRLQIFNRGRSSADCGELIDYDVAGPVVRILRYLDKRACDGVIVEPDTWPPADLSVLQAYASAVTDRRFARLLHAAMLMLPDADWLTHGLARTDMNGDGRQEQWVGGYSESWKKSVTYFHLVMEQDGELRVWHIPTEIDVPGALCQPIVDLTLWEEGRQILLESRICPPLRIAWDVARNDIRIFEE